MGKTSKRRPMQISDEEYTLRWAIARGEINLSDKEFVKRVKEIRKRTGKP